MHKNVCHRGCILCHSNKHIHQCPLADVLPHFPCSQWSDEEASGSESAQEEEQEEAALRSASDVDQTNAADVAGASSHFPAG